MSRDLIRPFLISRDAEGNVRLSVRDVRYNSQGYPLVTAVLQDTLFETVAAARSFARTNFKAVAGQYELTA
ncbi:MAG: hypothetical protein ACK44O_06720 [Novosphingobium sp.]|jgi:hypothetical protein|uniref:hypothetical protein n=1 Tax=Novosphingobium sp. TaxID=1874826 RepID=UPI003918ACC2|nr:hypothetical protein [Novosphingobium sp.]